MAESANNDQERDTSYPRDEENQPDSPKQNQRKEASMIVQNPQEDSQPSTSAQQSTEKESRPMRAERGNGCKWLTGRGEKKRAEEMIKKPQNPTAKSSTKKRKRPTTPQGVRTSSAGKSPQSSLKWKVQEPPGPGLMEETLNRQESTGEKENTESTTTEEKGSISVRYKWNKQGIKKGTTGINTPVIDFVKQVLKSKSLSTKKSGYLFICAREHNAIVNPWVPCGALQGGEILELDLRRINSPKISNEECKDDDDKIVGPERYKYPTFHDGLFFKVKCQGSTKGGKERKIIKKTRYYSNDYPMAVFGLKGETIKEALQNDKRFLKLDEFSLDDSDCKTASNVLLSDLNAEKTYTIVLHKSGGSGKRSRKEKSAHKDLQNNVDGNTSPLSGTSVPQSEPSVDPPNQLVPVSSRLGFKFSSEFQHFLKNNQQEKVESLLANTYKKAYKGPMTATTFRLLNKHLDNVALFKYDIGGKGGPSGTLFLVTENLGITCYHVVKLLIKSRAACSNVQVIFNYERKENMFCGRNIRVVWANSKLDCAFVRIEKTLSLPGLLKYLSPPPQDGAVNIIGHPSGKCKHIDPNCTVIDFNFRADSIADTILSDRSYIHVLTQHNFMRMNDPTLVTYDSCLYWGASGAPVFDSHGELVAMHTGGYPANIPLKKQSVIEYGRSAVDIIIHGAINIKDLRAPFRKLVEEKENLRKYLQPGGHPVKMQPYIRRLQKLWEESDRQTEQNTRVDVSDITESPMDTS